jgi:hypothetical protein
MLVATAHGTVLGDIMRNPDLARLVGGLQPVILGDEAARRGGNGGVMRKTRLERAGAAVFPLLVELQDLASWRLHLSVEASVDAQLQGRAADAHVREWDEAGTEGSGSGGGGGGSVGAAAAVPAAAAGSSSAPAGNQGGASGAAEGGLGRRVVVHFETPGAVALAAAAAADMEAAAAHGGQRGLGSAWGRGGSAARVAGRASVLASGGAWLVDAVQRMAAAAAGLV